MDRTMKQVFIILVIFCLIMSSGLAMGQEEPKRGGTLNVGLHIPFPTLDWQSTVGHPLPQGMVNVYEGLFGMGKDFNPQPELVDTYKVSDDSLTWTFGLRKGVLFHNGKEMTAEDVKASIERWKKVGPKGPMLKDLREIEIVDKHAVNFHFNVPMGRFLFLILGGDENKAIIMPKEIAEASPEGGVLTEIVGTGPYEFVEYRTEEYLRLKRFDKYVSRDDAPNYQTGGKVPYLDEIIFWIVPEASTRVAGLETGEYDVITQVPDTEYQRLKDAEGVVPVINQPAVLMYMMFNHKKGLMSDVNMRKAVQATINVDEVVQSVVSDKAFGTVNPSFFSPGGAYETDQSAELYNQKNIEKVKEYLEKAGYNGEPIRYLVLRISPTNTRTNVAVTEQMKAAGMNAEFLNYDLATWVAKRSDPDEFEIFSSEGYWVDPSLFHAEFGGKFAGWFISPETEEVFTKLAQEAEFDKRYALGEELQRLFYEKVATVNLGYFHRLRAMGSWVKDPAGNMPLGNLTLNNIWLDR